MKITCKVRSKVKEAPTFRLFAIDPELSLAKGQNFP